MILPTVSQIECSKFLSAGLGLAEVFPVLTAGDLSDGEPFKSLRSGFDSQDILHIHRCNKDNKDKDFLAGCNSGH